MGYAWRTIWEARTVLQWGCRLEMTGALEFGRTHGCRVVLSRFRVSTAKSAGCDVEFMNKLIDDDTHH
ncbi:hypothetical protein SLA2020_257980 [Shorea laevis]